MKFAKAGTTASEGASAVSGRRSPQRRAREGEPEKVSGAGQFSAGSNFPPFELELRDAAGDGRVLHALDIVFPLLRQTVAWIPLPPSLQFLFLLVFRLPLTPVSRLLSLLTHFAILLRSALLSGLSFAALNFFRPPSALRLHPRSVPARPISPIALPSHWAFLRSTLLRGRRRMHG